MSVSSKETLVTIKEANEINIKLTMDNIYSYVYILDKHFEVPFYYPFRFVPTPYSPDLERDLIMLMEALFIRIGSLIFITEKGKEVVNKLLNKEESIKEFALKVRKALEEMKSWDEDTIFRFIYLKITR